MLPADQRDRRFKLEERSGRKPDQIDRDRLLYCPHFARLADVTQVRTIEGDYLVHNRLTHSLKVGQLARRMTEKLLDDEADQGRLANGWNLSPEVAEAAGLAHDLGHPPFGHIAETELNELLQDVIGEGYEGNAQSFRIVARLGISDVPPVKTAQEGLLLTGKAAARGLNLTRATLNAVLKYPWLEGQNPAKPEKWGAYRAEQRLFEWIREDLPHLRRSPEAEIMDWADDITYAIHDMVDFFCAGLIPLHLLSRGPDGREWENFLSRAKARKPELAGSEYVSELDRVRTSFPEVAYDGSLEHTRKLWLMITILIAPLVEALELTEPDTNRGRFARVDPKATNLVKILQELTWAYVIQSPDLALIQHGQRKMIATLFEIHYENAMKRGWCMFPAGSSKNSEEEPGTMYARLVADYISGLTERQVDRIYRKITGR